MEIKHEWEHGPEIIYSSVDCQEIRHELKLLEPILNNPEDTGTATDEDGTAKKENKGIFFQEVYLPKYAPCSPTSNALEEFINAAKSYEYTPNSVFQGLYNIQGFNILFSAYKDKDYYKPHRDNTKLTALLWVGEKNFEGGDLYLPDFNYTIPYEPNKLIMFPSYYQHEVTPISTDQEGFVRYCASAFIN